MSDKQLLTLGAGPTGLAAAHELLHQNFRPIVFEQTDKAEGIARTETYKNYFFDISGHRFFTKNDRVNKLRQEMISSDFLKVGPASCIYYKGRLFKHPLSILNTLLNLGIFESALMMLSYLYSQIRPYPEIEKKEDEVHINTKAVGLNPKKARIVSVAYRNGQEAGEIPKDALS